MEEEPCTGGNLGRKGYYYLSNILRGLQIGHPSFARLPDEPRGWVFRFVPQPSGRRGPKKGEEQKNPRGKWEMVFAAVDPIEYRELRTKQHTRREEEVGGETTVNYHTMLLARIETLSRGKYLCARNGNVKVDSKFIIPIGTESFLCLRAEVGKLTHSMHFLFALFFFFFLLK